jgi:hypothetical protein
MSRGKKRSNKPKTLIEMTVKDVERLARKALKDSGLTIRQNSVYSSDRIEEDQSSATKMFNEMARRPFE